MKKARIILGCVGLGLVVGVLLVILHAGGSELSMTVLDYHRWPHGVSIRLVNNTGTTVRYLTERDSTPAGSPILRRQQTPTGWIDRSPPVVRGVTLDITPGTTTVAFYVTETGRLPRPGERVDVLQNRELKPGQSVRFFVRLEPDGPPIRVGTVCMVPEGPISKRLRPYLDRLKVRFGAQPSLPGHREVWCPEPLQIPSSQRQFAED